MGWGGWVRRYRVVIAAAVVVAGLGWCAAVSADGQNAGGHTTPDGGQVVVVVPGTPPTERPRGGPRGGGPAAVLECRYFLVSVPAGVLVPGVGAAISDTSVLAKGEYVWLICRDVTAGVIVSENLFVWDPANPPALIPSAEVLAQTAVNGMRLPLPGVQTFPPAGRRGLVNLPVWLHVDNWETISASASAGGLTATVEAVPVRAEWDMDDGAVTCTDAGSAYDASLRPDPSSSTCSYTYRRSSGVRADRTFHNSAVVVWQLRWFATNGQGGDLGELAGPRASFGLQIEESQALVAPGGR